MLNYAAIFFVIAIIAAVFGFGGIATGATEIAKILFSLSSHHRHCLCNGTYQDQTVNITNPSNFWRNK